MPDVAGPDGLKVRGLSGASCNLGAEPTLGPEHVHTSSEDALAWV